MSDRSDTNTRTLAIDIGGSGCKALVLDVSGEPLTERTRIPTPEKPTPEAVLDVLAELAAMQGEFERISAGFPGVVVNGEIRTAVNLDDDWVGFHLAGALEQRIGRPAKVANDADIQGYGVIEGAGVEMVLTLGTGVGSAMFIDGVLVPNLELGHHPFRRSQTYEEVLGEEALKEEGRKRWNKRLAEAVDLLAHIFNYRVLYLGGGNAKKLDIDLPSNVVQVSNRAGLWGGIALWRS